MGPSLQAKKKVDRSSIIEVNDIKPFKKLQRTHTNLLVLFAQSGEFFIFTKSNSLVEGIPRECLKSATIKLNLSFLFP